MVLQNPFPIFAKKRNMEQELRQYLEWRFKSNNHPKYRNYANEWIVNVTYTQLNYFKRERENLIKKGDYQPC